ncbi:hypothetical protein CPB85DRAFT_674195 [Mucidula mucida]|nr:hypothetical protein CPB85DRAFT_674195 [Mucidula mucida]
MRLFGFGFLLTTTISILTAPFLPLPENTRLASKCYSNIAKGARNGLGRLNKPFFFWMFLEKLLFRLLYTLMNFVARGHQTKWRLSCPRTWTCPTLIKPYTIKIFLFRHSHIFHKGDKSSMTDRTPPETPQVHRFAMLLSLWHGSPGHWRCGQQ